MTIFEIFGSEDEINTTEQRALLDSFLDSSGMEGDDTLEPDSEEWELALAMLDEFETRAQATKVKLLQGHPQSEKKLRGEFKLRMERTIPVSHQYSTLAMGAFECRFSELPEEAQVQQRAAFAEDMKLELYSPDLQEQLDSIIFAYSFETVSTGDDPVYAAGTSYSFLQTINQQLAPLMQLPEEEEKSRIILPGQEDKPHNGHRF